MTGLRPARRLVAELVNARHQLTDAHMQTVSEFEQLQVRRVGLTALDRVDLIETQASAVIRDALGRHVLPLSDQHLDGLGERGMIAATWLGLPGRWHGRKLYRSRAREDSQYIGYHCCRRLSTAQFAMTSSHEHQSLIRLGRNIRQLREEKQLDGKQVAERAHLPHWQLTAIEEGRHDPGYDTLIALADVLGVGVAALVPGEEADHA